MTIKYQSDSNAGDIAIAVLSPEMLCRFESGWPFVREDGSRDYGASVRLGGAGWVGRSSEGEERSFEYSAEILRAIDEAKCRRELASNLARRARQKLDQMILDSFNRRG